MEEEPKFYIGDEVNVISFSVSRDLLGNSRNDDSVDLNTLDVAFYQCDEDGWGCGGDVYISSQDLIEISNGMEKVIFEQDTFFEYITSGEKILKISLAYDAQSHTYCLVFGMIEVLLMEYYITVKKDNLTADEIKDFFKPLKAMKQRYPVIQKDTNLDYDFVHRGIKRYIGKLNFDEALFNFSVMDMLDNNDLQLEEKLKKTRNIIQEADRMSVQERNKREEELLLRWKAVFE